MMRAEKTIRKFNSVARGRCLLDQVRIMPAKLPLSGPPPLFLRPRNLRRFYDPLSSLRVILFHALAITLASHQREEELFTEENSSIFESIFWESLRNSRVLLVFERVRGLQRGLFCACFWFSWKGLEFFWQRRLQALFGFSMLLSRREVGDQKILCLE